MCRRALFAVLTALATLAAACSDPPPIHHEGQVPSDGTAAPAPGAGVGPGGEMIPGLALPAKLTGPGEIPAGAGRPELLAATKRALAESRGADAVSIADVLLVLDPQDAEVLELRARALELQDDATGAADDRRRCCDLGRADCCR